MTNNAEDTHPEDGDAHEMAARAYSAAHDKERCCSHVRAAAQLPGASDRVRHAAVRCLAERGELELARVEARQRAPWSVALASRLEAALIAGRVPRPLALPAPDENDSLQVAVRWAAGARSAPTQLVTPEGRVFSPWSAANRADPAAAPATRGRYLVVAHAASGARARITARADGAATSVRLRAATSPLLAIIDVR